MKRPFDLGVGIHAAFAAPLGEPGSCHVYVAAVTEAPAQPRDYLPQSRLAEPARPVVGSEVGLSELHWSPDHAHILRGSEERGLLAGVIAGSVCDLGQGSPHARRRRRRKASGSQASIRHLQPPPTPIQSSSRR